LIALRLLLPHLRPYWSRALAAGAALLIAALMTLALGQGVARLVDGGLAAGSAPRLDTAAALMFGIVAAPGAATAARYYFVSWLGERIAADLRRRVYGRPASRAVRRARAGADAPAVAVQQVAGQSWGRHGRQGGSGGRHAFRRHRRVGP
jgi:ABC-type multidrug transport system fused ATPase/permease subunit